MAATTIAKTKISQLATLSAATATTVIPVSNGSGIITTYKITPDNLIKDTASLAAKANLSGGNTISGPQDFTGSVNVGLGLYAKADLKVDGDIILNKEEQIKFTDNTEFPMSKMYHLSNVTSDIQAQFTSASQATALKAPIASPTFTGTATIPSANVTTLAVSGSASVPNGTASGHAVNKGQLDLKANLAGGNSFTGNQSFSAGVDIAGILDVSNNILCSSNIEANSASITQELSLSNGATILYNTNPIPGEKLLYIKNVTFDVQAQLNAKAGLDSPDFDGTPTAITPSVGDNSNRIATTSFVNTAISIANDNYIIAAAAELDVDFPDPTAEPMPGKYAYNVNSQNLYFSNGDGYILAEKHLNKLYFFMTENTGSMRGKFYLWNGIDFVN